MMLSCKEISQLVSLSLDESLPIWRRMQVRMHLFLCRFCARFRQQLLFLRDVAQHHAAAEGDLELHEVMGLTVEARERIKRLLQSERN